jgi:hypothetical protein
MTFPPSVTQRVELLDWFHHLEAKFVLLPLTTRATFKSQLAINGI